jgi:bifunctional N-acetylglucosamine-1-phosphate-uridyltransferase/glucosamine-1-phosphate-acetyltransferase GlmU-like protein
MVTTVALKDKILEMYPEIMEHHLSAAVDFDGPKNAYIVTFRREGEELKTLIEKKDAEDCMNNIKCVYLGVQVAQFIKNFDERLAFKKNKAA